MLMEDPGGMTYAVSKEKQSSLSIIWEAAYLKSAKFVHHPFFLEMLAQTLPSCCAATYINDQVQVFTDVLSLSKNNRESLPVPNYVSALRNAFIDLNIESTSLVKDSSFVGPISFAAQKMKRLIESKVESKDSIDALLTWTVVLRLRDFLAKTITDCLPQSGAATNPYGVWLRTFAKSQFQACITVVEEELMRVLPKTMNAAEMERLQSISNSVLQFELALLDSAYARRQTTLQLPEKSQSPWHPSNIIFTTDFDVTCTVIDSCEALVRAAEAAAMRSQGDFQPGRLHEVYEALLDQHSERTRKALCSLESPEENCSEVTPSSLLSGRHEHAEDLVPGMDPLVKPLFESSKTSLCVFDQDCLGVAFDEAGLRKALTKLGKLEELCNQDIMSAGVLAGFTREGIMAEAKNVLLRPSCPRVLQQLVEMGTAIHIVSANWSRDLVTGGLPELPKGKLFVHCNDLLFDNSEVSRGLIDMTVVDAFDKEEMLRALRKLYSCLKEDVNLQPQAGTPAQTTASQHALNLGTDRRPDKMVVYLGDSHTDLLGLLEADLGIVIGETLTIRRVMSLYGIQLRPLVEASTYLSLARLNGAQRSWRRSGILFEAQGWEDVETCLFGGLATGNPVCVASEEILKNSEDLEEQSIQQPRCEMDVTQERPSSMNLKLIQVAG